MNMFICDRLFFRFSILCMLVISFCACSKKESVPKDFKKLVVTYRDNDTNAYLELSVDKTKFTEVITWLKKYAIPEPSPKTIGSVMPMGGVYFYADEVSEAPIYSVAIYNSKTRSEPEDVHVSIEDWEGLLELIKSNENE